MSLAPFHTAFLPFASLPAFAPDDCAAFQRAFAELHRDDAGRFAAEPRDVPLLVRPVKSAAHVRGEATKRAVWVAKRDAMTARLVAGL